MKKSLLALLLTASVFNVNAQVANQADDLVLCDIDNDGFEIFDLTTNDPVIIGGQNPAELSLTYHLTQADADLGVNVILSPQNYVNTANPEGIFARLESVANGNFDTTNFTLIVEPIPLDFGPFELVLCDDYLPNDGVRSFDLTTLENQITEGDPNMMVAYYATLDDLQNNLPIADPTDYVNVTNPQVVHGRVTNNVSGCFSDIIINLRVIFRPEVNMVPSTLEACGEGGFAVFDLTLKDEEIANGIPNVRVNYFGTMMDAQNDILPIIGLYTNDDIFVDSVWVRVTYEVPPYELPCFGVIELYLIVLDGCPDIDAPPLNIFIDEGDGNGVAQFDFTVNESLMLGSQDPTVYLFSYHTSFEDAQQDENPIANPSILPKFRKPSNNLCEVL